MSGPKDLKKGDLLFREGDASDCMYVIKSGRIAIMKAKGASEIVLAELNPGDMLGEMAFFDNKPRSASARALADAVVIELPFKALNAQFKTFPEWLKAIVRQVNTHLRNANQKIKNLERAAAEEEQILPPHTVTKLMAILCLTAKVYGEKGADGLTLIPPIRLRNYTIQVFSQPTNKMEKLLLLLQSMNYLKIEELGEGKQKITSDKVDFMLSFMNFYNDYLFEAEDKRLTINEKELKPMKTVMFYAKDLTPDDKGMVKVNLTQMQNDSMKDLGYLFTVDDVNSLIVKKLINEKMTGEGGQVFISFKKTDIEHLYPNWELIYAFTKVQRS